MTAAEEIASIIEELTADHPTACTIGDYEFTALKGFDSSTPMGFAPTGYDDDRREEFHVMAHQFTEENPAPEYEDEIGADGEGFKITEVTYYPNKTTPLFYKFGTIKQN